MAALGLDAATKTVSDPQSDPAYLREQVRFEREGREAAEAEAKAARELAADARKRVDQVRSSRAESDLDDAMELRRRTLALSHERDDRPRTLEPAPGVHGAMAWAGGRARDFADRGSVAQALREHRENIDLGALGPKGAMPERTRGHGMQMRDTHMIEQTLMTAIDGKAGQDTDASRREVITRILRACSRHGDRYVNADEFAIGIGKFSLGAAPHAGHKVGAAVHHVIRQPLQPTFDVSQQVVNVLFERYSEPSGGDGERLVDCDAFYGRLRRNVKSMPGMGRMGRMLSWPGEP